MAITNHGAAGRYFGLHAIVISWFLAGVGIGVFLAWQTVSRNLSIRTPRDALVLTSWIAGGYGLCMMGLGVITRVVMFHVDRRDAMPKVRIAAHLPAAVVFFVVFSFMIAMARDGGLWPDSTAVKVILVLLFLCIAWLASWYCCFLLDSTRPSRATSGVVVILFVAATSVLASSSIMTGFSRQNDSQLKIASVPRAATDRRVILLGMDGVEWKVLNRLMAERRLPNFTRLCESSARARTVTLWPTYSPIIWTSIATGVSESRHGVQDFTELHVPGMSRGVQRFHTRPTHLPANVGLIKSVELLIRWGDLRLSPISAVHRRAKALWNVATDAGASVAVVNWYATYPAEAVNGFLISDRNTVSFRGGTYAPLEGASGLMFPDSIANELKEAELAYPRPDPTFILNHPDREQSEKPPVKSETDSINQEFEVDHFAASAALWLYMKYDVDLTMVYLPGNDRASHTFGEYYDFVIDRYYVLLDSWLGRFMDAADENTVLIVVSDHGWSYNPKNIGHYHAPDGVLIASGPGIKNGELQQEPSVADIAPTTLALLGIAVAQDLDGQVIDAMLSDNVPVTTTYTYGSYDAPTPPSALGMDLREDDAQAIKRLKALGYIGE